MCGSKIQKVRSIPIFSAAAITRIWNGFYRKRPSRWGLSSKHTWRKIPAAHSIEIDMDRNVCRMDYMLNECHFWLIFFSNHFVFYKKNPLTNDVVERERNCRCECVIYLHLTLPYTAMIRAIEREKERNPWLLIDGRMSLMLKRWTFLTQQPERNNCILCFGLISSNRLLVIRDRV